MDKTLRLSTSERVCFSYAKNFYKNLLTFVSPYVIILMVTQKRGEFNVSKNRQTNR